MTEDREMRTENRRQKTENSRQITEDKWRKRGGDKEC